MEARTYLHLHLFALVSDLLDALFDALAERLLALCWAIFRWDDRTFLLQCTRDGHRRCSWLLWNLASAERGRPTCRCLHHHLVS